MRKMGRAEDGEIRDEYDFSTAVKNPYAELANRRSNLVMIEPDLLEVFADSEAVNGALRLMLNASRIAVRSQGKAREVESQEHLKAS